MGYKEFMGGLFDENLTFLDGMISYSTLDPSNVKIVLILYRRLVEWDEVIVGASILSRVCIQVFTGN